MIAWGVRQHSLGRGREEAGVTWEKRKDSNSHCWQGEILPPQPMPKHRSIGHSTLEWYLTHGMAPSSLMFQPRETTTRHSNLDLYLTFTAQRQGTELQDIVCLEPIPGVPDHCALGSQEHTEHQEAPGWWSIFSDCRANTGASQRFTWWVCTLPDPAESKYHMLWPFLASMATKKGFHLCLLHNFCLHCGIFTLSQATIGACKGSWVHKHRWVGICNMKLKRKYVDWMV